jgi:hypothetical protein
MTSITSRPGRSVALLGLIVLLSSACATASPGRYSPARSITLDVTNRGQADVVVYMTDGDVLTRLGRVRALERTRLVIPRTQGPIHLIVRALGSSHEVFAEAVWAVRGQVVQLTVQPVLGSSDVVMGEARSVHRG